MDFAIDAAIGVAIFVEFVVVIIAGAYILVAYWNRSGDALFYTRMVVQDLRIVFGVALTLALVGLNQFGIPTRPWGGRLIALALFLVVWGVISDALVIRGLRKGGSTRRMNDDDR